MVAWNRKNNMLVERPRPGVWVVRFARPDLSDQLYPDADADASPLYQELWGQVLHQVQEGQVVILNLGLVEPLATAFYRCLLKVREVLKARGARLFLCRLSPDHEEVFALFKAFHLFHVVPTERRALHEATTSRGNAADPSPRPWPGQLSS
jgi:anti-anti-sigma regulatory factor